MGFARGDARDHIVSHKTATDLRIGAKEPCSGRDGQQTTFARFSVPFDFRLFQQYRRKADTHKDRQLAGSADSRSSSEAFAIAEPNCDPVTKCIQKIVL